MLINLINSIFTSIKIIDFDIYMIRFDNIDLGLNCCNETTINDLSKNNPRAKALDKNCGNNTNYKG